ncbi:MAG: sugar phosphate isomerase/epimerase [Gemmataceae bacterium]|nr:sugar phosphate isomerase/epimerase [Gemmataceae bacterium]MDW8265562.1 sugar phosphate isomerase/epimerase [Gemmataceae bacterium]
MFVACSTLCFSKLPLADALRRIAELEFNKVDVAIHEQGTQLKPTEVAADVARVAQLLKLGSGLMPAAFSVEIATTDRAEYGRLLQAICRLARLTTAPLVSIPAASAGTGLDAEVPRLSELVRLAESEGILLTVETRRGTITETPAAAVELCERVKGLGLTLDPSHYLTGPHQGKNFDLVYPWVRHVRLRDSGRGPDQFQVRIGQGEIEYGRIVTQLQRFQYDRVLTVDIRDTPEPPFPVEPEVRKLKYLLESLV